MLRRNLVWKNVPYIFIGAHQPLLNKSQRVQSSLETAAVLMGGHGRLRRFEHAGCSVRAVGRDVFFHDHDDLHGEIWVRPRDTERPVQINGFSTTPTGTVIFGWFGGTPAKEICIIYTFLCTCFFIKNRPCSLGRPFWDFICSFHFH